MLVDLRKGGSLLWMHIVYYHHDRIHAYLQYVREVLHEDGSCIVQMLCLAHQVLYDIINQARALVCSECTCVGRGQ